MTEEWRATGINGYEVSNHGRVRSLPRKRTRGGILRPGISSGYQMLSLGGRSRLVHRLVLVAFRGPCPEGLECAHLDGNRFNNALANLVWVTKTENEAHKRLHGTNPKKKTDRDNWRAKAEAHE